MYKITSLNQSSGSINSINKFYSNSRYIMITNAAHGWHYTAGFESEFITNESNNIKEIKTKHLNAAKNNKIKQTADDILKLLNKERNIPERFIKLKKLTENEDKNLTHDSFYGRKKIDVLAAQKNTFKKDRLNFLIIGAGVAGLYLACTLKFVLGKKANILVLDNRSNKKHAREIFKRDWLTHLPYQVFQNFAPPNIRELLGCFGMNGLIGLHINLLETLLMLACKDQGVKFYFASDIDYSKLGNELITCLFDATGGRMDKNAYSYKSVQKNEIEFHDLIANYQYEGLRPTDRDLSKIKMKLNATGNIHFPYFEDTKIQTHMFKVTGIPGGELEAIYEYITPRNSDNSMYLWQGALKPEFNEGLVFINITQDEFKFLNEEMNSSVDLTSFLQLYEHKLPNEKIISFLKILSTLNKEDSIKVDKPFSYAPYINLNAGHEFLGEKPIFPVGDSYFTGNPKVGNGLWTHFGFINELVKTIAMSNRF